MSRAQGTRSPTLSAGDIVRLHSEYQSTHPADDVMGIMLMYIQPN
jgi:hypothetical protein